MIYADKDRLPWCSGLWAAPADMSSRQQKLILNHFSVSFFFLLWTQGHCWKWAIWHLLAKCGRRQQHGGGLFQISWWVAKWSMHILMFMIHCSGMYTSKCNGCTVHELPLLQFRPTIVTVVGCVLSITYYLYSSHPPPPHAKTVVQRTVLHPGPSRPLP